MGLTVDHVVYMPTNRPSSKALADVLREIISVSDHHGGLRRFHFLLLDTSDDVAQAEHAAMMRDAMEAGLTFTHLDRSHQSAFVESLSVSDRVRELLLPEGTSYGRGPNLAALWAYRLGARTLHRRDSDQHADAGAWPLQLELQALGSRVGDVAPTVHRLPDNFDQALIVSMVGTGDIGSPPFDRRDLLAAGEDWLVGLQALGRPGDDTEDIRLEAIRYLIEEPCISYAHDFFEYDVDARTEMGCIAILADRLVIPEMPTGIIGCDYMVKDLMWRLGEPLLFHSRKSKHAWSDNRTHHRSLDDHVSYCVRDVQYLQMGRVWQRHTAAMTDAGLYRTFREFNPHSYARSFRNASEQSSSELEAVRRGALEVYTGARDATRRRGDLTTSTRLGSVASALEERGPDLDAEVMRAVGDFCELVGAWPGLLTAAARYED